MDFALSFNTPRSGIWGTCICLWILKQKSITSVPSFAALCLLCNTKRDKDSVTPTWLDRNPLSESSECEWVYFKDFYFFFEIDFSSSHIYILSPSLLMDISLGFFSSSFFPLISPLFLIPPNCSQPLYHFLFSTCHPEQKQTGKTSRAWTKYLHNALCIKKTDEEG